MSLKSTSLILFLIIASIQLQLQAQEKTRFHAFKIGGLYTALDLGDPAELVGNELSKNRYGVTVGWRREKVAHQFINYRFGFNLNLATHYYEVDDAVNRFFGFNNFNIFSFPESDEDVVKTEVRYLYADLEMPVALSIEISKKYYAFLGGSVHSRLGQDANLTVYRAPFPSPREESRGVQMINQFGVNHFLGFGYQKEIGKDRFFFLETQFKSRLSPEFTPQGSRMRPFYLSLTIGTKW